MCCMQALTFNTRSNEKIWLQTHTSARPSLHMFTDTHNVFMDSDPLSLPPWVTHSHTSWWKRGRGSVLCDVCDEDYQSKTQNAGAPTWLSHFEAKWLWTFWAEIAANKLSRKGYGHHEPKWLWVSVINSVCIFATLHSPQRNRQLLQCIARKNSSSTYISFYIHIHIHMFSDMKPFDGMCNRVLYSR